MLEKVLFPFILFHYVVTTKDVACDRNRTFLEVPGDVVLSVFVDANDGPYCNVSSFKGFQEASTAVYVVQTLNKYDYVPGLLLGVKGFDTCYDEVAVYKQALMATVDLDCASTYDLGILISDGYSSIVKSFEKYSALPISTYKQQNFTKALLDIMVNFTSTKFEVIDLFLTTSQFVLDHFLETSKDAGICVKSHAEIVEEPKNDEETVVAVAGCKEDIRSWIENGEKIRGPRTIWIVLALDGSHVDDLIPAGSYLIEAEPFTFDLPQEFSSVDDFLETTEQSVIHSPHLLSIGKAIVELAQVLRDLQKRTCPHGATCVLPPFNLELPRRQIENIEVYEALHILPKSHPVRYVAMKNAGERTLVQLAMYGIDAIKEYVTSETSVPKVPGLCSNELSKNCQECANFRKSENARNIVGTGSADKGFLKRGNSIAIYLAIAVCGSFACVVIIVFILYRFFVDEVLDGNPTLTIFLALSTVLVLQTVLPFCMDDEIAGSEQLNSRKIFLTTLSVGLVFSVMLSRALFLAFSTSGHINGSYLQGLLVFFMAGVQIAISIMYFVLNRDDPVVIVRSMTFIALLGYDIFLLAKLFVVCCFVAQIQQNYREGKCFFGTVIGLVVVWGVWVTCFIFVETEMRDAVVCSGIIATSYLVIIGILVPRTYHMLANVGKKKDLARSFGPDLGTNSIAKQFKFYNYVIPTPSVSNLHPNYYGSSSPRTRYVNRYKNADFPKTQDNSNYGFDSEMREIENVYETPRIYYRNTEVRPNPLERRRTDSDRLQPYGPKQSNIAFNVMDCIETDVYVEGRPLPSPRGPDEAYPSRNVSPKMSPMEATIDEEDEEDEVTRITRF